MAGKSKGTGQGRRGSKGKGMTGEAGGAQYGNAKNALQSGGIAGASAESRVTLPGGVKGKGKKGSRKGS